MTDRALTLAFAVSLGAHLLLLAGQLVSMDWLTIPKRRAAIDVIYEYEIAQQKLQQLTEQLAEAKRRVASASAPSTVGERPRIRIPERPMLADTNTPIQHVAERSAIIDLTNLVNASQGNPVLLSYFSAIRQQIQQTANRQAWLTGQTREGLVYVSFVLNSSGNVRQVEIVADRSAASPPLRDVAARIVKAAAPFPPFPPSMLEPHKTIIVPLEFLLGS